MHERKYVFPAETGTVVPSVGMVVFVFSVLMYITRMNVLKVCNHFDPVKHVKV